MRDRLRFILRRFGERLWVKPLVVCLLSIGVAFLATLLDDTGVAEYLPEVAAESVQRLLGIMASSMLVIATFAVGSMVSAYASASSTATPRTFSIVVSDDVSQNALSTFVGAFIFSIVALVALQNDYYERAGLFGLFLLTLVVFAAVVVIFVRWVDQIARLGRLGSTISLVEAATVEALQRRRRAPTLGGIRADGAVHGGTPVYAGSIGYLQRVDVPALQACAEHQDLRITVAELPGTFAAPDRPLAFVQTEAGVGSEINVDAIARAFTIGEDRKFDEDPRFGLIVLSQIGSRALSPAVNDPGTAIDLLGTFIRLFFMWCAPADGGEQKAPSYDRVTVPELSIDDMFDDAFTAIARDGAGIVEVAVRLQKALRALSASGHAGMEQAARRHSSLAFARAEHALTLPEDLEAVRRHARPGDGA